MASQAIDLLTLIHCLQLSEQFLGKGRTWKGLKPAQIQFLELYSQFGAEVEQLSFLKGMASRDITQVNAFLKEEGFDIQLNPVSDPQGFGVASVLKLLMEWLEEGKEAQIYHKRTAYPAFQLKSKQGVSFFHLPHYEDPLVSIETKTGERVCLMTADRPLSGLALADEILMLAKKRRDRARYGAVIVPDVDLDVQPDVSWIQGLSTFDDQHQPWFVAQAGQQVKYRMNRFGAKIETGSMMSVMRGGSLEESFAFDRPFYTWVEGQGQVPLAMLYVDTDSWKATTLD
jgi:hypothetical protein